MSTPTLWYLFVDPLKDTTTLIPGRTALPRWRCGSSYGCAAFRIT